MKLVVSLLLAGVLTFAQTPQLIHKVNPKYPPEAKMARVQGAVLLEITISAKGAVQDARVISGPAELRRAALEAVLQWQYEPLSNEALAQVTINFTLMNEPQSPPLGSIRSIEFDNIGETVKLRILGRLTLKAGDLMKAGDLNAIQAIASDVDRGVRASFGDDMVLRFDASPVVRVGGNVQASKIVKQVAPVYPPLAKQARIQGTVRMNATIDRDGRISNLELMSGHPLLVPAATEAVKQWEYEKTLLNGQPVAVITQIDVNFTLAPQTTSNQQ